MKLRFCLKRFTEVAYGPSFYPRGSKLSLFSLYGQRFPRYGSIFKIAIFGHKTWPLAKVPEIAHTLSTHGVEIELIFALQAAVSEIRTDFHFKIAMFRHDTFPLAKILEVAQALLSPPECGNSTYFLRTGLSEI